MKKNILLFVLLFSFLQISKASHKMGADIYYRYLGNDNYKIVIKFYRDCRGVPFNSPTVSVGFGNNGSTTCSTYALTATRTSIRDVSQICADSAAPCNPVNTPLSGSGVEEHIYEMTVDISKPPFSTHLSQPGCKEAIFSFGQCCRNGAITTGPAGNDFWVTCTINFENLALTNKNYNHSPVFSNKPIIYACCNKPLYMSPCAIDSADQDSLAYRLVHAIGGLPNNTVQYNTPFSYKIPLTPYCISPKMTCTPNINANPPVGFYFDSTTGDIIFTPTKCDEVGIIAIEVSEFRRNSSTGKMVLIGKTRRDMQLIISENCGYNNAPKFVGNSVYKVCEGDKLCFTIDVQDEAFLPQQKQADTLDVSWNTDIKNATVKIKDSTSREKQVEFCWQTNIGDSKNTPYLLSIHASDQHCPTPILQSKTYKIIVEKCVSIHKFNNNRSVLISPNPAENYITLSFSEEQCEVIITDIFGKIYLKKETYKKGDIINTSALQNGLYFIHCNFGNYNTVQQCVIRD